MPLRINTVELTETRFGLSGPTLRRSQTPPALSKGSNWQPGIVAILPRGEAIRNFVHTGALDYLQETSDLTVLSVIPDSGTYKTLESRFSRVVPLLPTPDKYAVGLVRELLDMAHGRHLWSMAARERWRLRDTEANTPWRRVKRQAKKLASYPWANEYGIRLLEKTERFVSRCLEPTDAYERLYKNLKPSLVFNGSHIHSAVAIHAVQAAQWLGIPTATFVFSWDNLTSQGRFIPTYDYYFVWNNAIREQLLKIYPTVRPDQVVVTGTPQFDFHFSQESPWTREEYCQRIGVDPGRKLVLYSTGMAEAYTAEPVIVEQIADLLPGMEELQRPQLVVRVYPKDLTGRFEDLRRRRPDIVFPPAKWVDAWLTPTQEDTQLFTNTLRHVDVGINVASTVSLELCMFDKPVLNVGYDPPGVNSVRVPYARYYEYDHYRPLVESGAVQLIREPSEMRAQLRKALANPRAHSHQRRAFIERMFGNTLDGRSHERVASALMKIAHRGGESD